MVQYGSMDGFYSEKNSVLNRTNTCRSARWKPGVGLKDVEFNMFLLAVFCRSLQNSEGIGGNYTGSSSKLQVSDESTLICLPYLTVRTLLIQKSKADSYITLFYLCFTRIYCKNSCKPSAVLFPIWYCIV